MAYSITLTLGEPCLILYAGIMDCRAALTETDGDIAKAKLALREKGGGEGANRGSQAAAGPAPTSTPRF